LVIACRIADLGDLKVAPQEMERLSDKSKTTLASSCAAKPTEEDEHVTDGDALVHEVLRRLLRLTEHRPPSGLAGTRVLVEVGIVMGEVGTSYAEFLHKRCKVVAGLPFDPVIWNTATPARDRQRNEATIREDWAAATSGRCVKAFATQD
jgi:hypothetical protein